MDNTAALISGYTAYTSAEEFGATATGEAPATTPAILSFIGVSSAPCGGLASTVVGGSVAGTVHWGC
jgi:hypothetical protein